MVTVRDLKAQTETQVPFSEIVTTAKAYVDLIGGFEKLAEWGLIRPGDGMRP